MVKFEIVEEVGIIKNIDGMTATVSIPRKSACEGCSFSACKAGEESMLIEALNPVNARVGQKVKILMKPYTYLKGSAIVYGIPAVALVAGAVLGKEVFSRYFVRMDPDILSAITGFIAFALSFLFIKIWSTKAAKKQDVKPVIKEILE
jgi:sigma-E factor negative regulatory protein RseC